MDKVDRIEREVVINASRQKVWEALTNTAEVVQWFGDIAEIDLRAGGAARFGWSEYGHVFEAVIETVEPMQRFAYRWADTTEVAVDDGPSTLVEFTLDSVDGGTKVKVVETGFAAFPDDIHAKSLEENQSGWRLEFEDLVQHLTVRLEV
jgi:uncharacterized protein YndB with AHSA1/START domain